MRSVVVREFVAENGCAVNAREDLSQRVLQCLACSDCGELELEALLVSDWRRCIARNTCAAVGTLWNSYDYKH